MAVNDIHSPDDLHFDSDEETSVLDSDVSEDDSGILVTQTIDLDLISVTQVGDTSIISFMTEHLHDDVCLAVYRERVLQLIADPTCKKLQFDLSNVKILPSGMVGLMASLRKRGYQIDLLNPSDDVRDVLRVMRMDSVFGIHESHS